MNNPNIQKKEKCWRALFQAAKFYPKEKVVKYFLDDAEVAKLTEEEKESVVKCISSIFLGIADENTIANGLRLSITDKALFVFKKTLTELDENKPLEFVACQTPLDVKLKMGEHKYTTTEKIENGIVFLTFSEFSHSTTYRIPIQYYSTLTVAKAAQMTLESAERFNYIINSQI